MLMKTTHWNFLSPSLVISPPFFIEIISPYIIQMEQIEIFRKNPPMYKVCLVSRKRSVIFSVLIDIYEFFSLPFFQTKRVEKRFSCRFTQKEKNPPNERRTPSLMMFHVCRENERSGMEWKSDKEMVLKKGLNPRNRIFSFLVVVF